MGTQTQWQINASQKCIITQISQLQTYFLIIQITT